jgi:2-amino-4-hydroxy-6-hydroxymethyldihydropteridine diphosphokinase
MMHDTPRAFIALGANLPFQGLAGPALLRAAVSAMEEAGLVIRARSSVWETAPWPPSDQPNYFNAVAELDRAGLEPQPLYATLRAIETRFGRERRARNGARTLDLDILAIDGFEGVFGDVTLPHARMTERIFVLCPLAEIAPEWRHPVDQRSVAELLAARPGAGEGAKRLEPL